MVGPIRIAAREGVEHRRPVGIGHGRLEKEIRITEAPDDVSRFEAKEQPIAHVPASSRLRRDDEMRVELECAGVLGHLTAKRQPQRPTNVRSQPAPSLAPRQDEIDARVGHENLLVKRAASTQPGDLRWVDHAPVQVGHAEPDVESHRSGKQKLVSTPNHDAVAGPDPRPARFALDVATPRREDLSGPNLAVGRRVRWVTHLRAGCRRKRECDRTQRGRGERPLHRPAVRRRMLDCGHRMRQSIELLRPLPPSRWVWSLVAVVAVVIPAVPASAQDAYRVRRTENFRKDPSAAGVLLATISEGVTLQGRADANGWIEVTLDGWIWSRSLSPTNREGHDRVVDARGGENLRASPNGRVLARVANGCLLDHVETREGWVRVRRTGWIWGRSLDAVQSTGSTTASPAPGAGATLDQALTANDLALHQSPDGPEVGNLGANAPVRIMARSGDWVRVQTEGWVRRSELKPAASEVRVGVSAAEVRSRPREFEGQLVQWTVQYISIQQADELRKDIPAGRKYILARGPLPEAGFVYIVVTDEQIAELEKLPPLTSVELVGRIRVGRSQFLGNPILDLVEMAVRDS